VRYDAAKEENRKERGENWYITDNIGSRAGPQNARSLFYTAAAAQINARCQINRPSRTRTAPSLPARRQGNHRGLGELRRDRQFDVRQDSEITVYIDRAPER
jgi:hypothetical protein